MPDKTLKENNHHSDKFNIILSKLILESIFPYQFICSDKPDLQNIKNNIGFEVTQANNKEIESLWVKYRNEENEKKKEKLKEVIYKKSNNTAKFDDILLTQYHKYNCNTPTEVFVSKLDKLQKNYKVFNSNNLIIIYEGFIALPGYLENLLKSFIVEQTSFSKKFDTVVIASNQVYVFKLNQMNIENIHLDIDKFRIDANNIIKGEN